MHNLTADVSADSTLFLGETDGRIYGCFGVFPPLVGSGPYYGKISDDGLRFSVEGRAVKLEFYSDGTPGSFTGSYKVRRIDGASEEGSFSLIRQNGKGLPSNFSAKDCPSDSDLAR